MSSGSTLARIVGNRDGSDPDIAALRELLRDYPYFAPAQVILAARLRKSGADPEEIKKQTGIAAVYLPDPFLLEHVLDRILSGLEDGATTLPASFGEAKIAKPQVEDAHDFEGPSLEASLEKELASGISGPPRETDAQKRDFQDQQSNQLGTEIPVPETGNVPSGHSNAELPYSHEGASGESTPAGETPVMAGEIPMMAGEGPDSESHPENARVEKTPEPWVEKEPAEAAPNPLIGEARGPMQSGPGISPPIGNPFPPPGPGIPQGGADELQNLIRPLYTEDYFAFQGIRLPEKLDDTKKPTSAQLKSFTDWLRAMKRPRGSMGPEGVHLQDKDRISSIYTVDEERGISTVVEKMALESIRQGDEVVTEAMAEIRYRQGQKEKAVAIYEKLSLLDPSKSGYFADKILEIRQSL